jgi:hypothetical protein
VVAQNLAAEVVHGENRHGRLQHCPNDILHDCAPIATAPARS